MKKRQNLIFNKTYGRLHRLFAQLSVWTSLNDYGCQRCIGKLSYR